MNDEIIEKVANELWKTEALGSHEDCEILAETLYDAQLLNQVDTELTWEYREYAPNLHDHETGIRERRLVGPWEQIT